MKPWLPESLRRLSVLNDHDADRVHARHHDGVRAVIDAPLPPGTRLLLWSLIAFVVAALVWASLGRVEIVAFAEGQTVVNSRVQPIQSVERAIVTAVLVREGERVDEGQPLIELEQTGAKAQVTSLQERYLRARAARKRVALLMGHGNGELPELDLPAEVPQWIALHERHLLTGQWHAHRAEIAELEQNRKNRIEELKTVRLHIHSIERVLPYFNDRVARMVRLSERDLASRAELDDARRELIEQENELQLQIQRKAELEGQVELAAHQLSRAELRFRSDLAEEYTAIGDQLAQFRERIADARAELARRTLRAPRTGVVQDVHAHSAGAVVQPGETLMRIVPEGQPLEVEARILNRDIGFAERGQVVNVKIDAFEFTRFGSVPGRIRDISPSSTEDEQLGHVYRALVELERDWIMANGRQVTLRPGMTATVDIEIGERRLIEYFLGPVLRYRDEALRER